MKIRTELFILTSLLAACASQPDVPPATPAPVAASSVTLPERAVRRTVPITNMIRRAYAAGTRDSTGQPGRNYWQLWVEYDINARLDVPTSTVSGRETIVLHNNSPESLAGIVLRLDQNLYAANVVRARTVPEITGGMKITRMTVNGQAVSLTAAAQGANQQPTTPTAIAKDLRLPLPEGATVRSLALSGDRLAVHFDAHAGAGVAILDLLTGEPVTHVQFVPRGPGR